jgi:tetratricopeptide (TPR) repeat protein
MWFRKRVQPDSDNPVQERWSTSFAWFGKRRLPDERALTYSARMRRGGYTLQIDKPDHFAWVTAPHKYRDLALEATLDFDPANGHCAAGFVLRYINEENFYYFLVSDRGSFRFDLLFNKNPLHLIEWTPCAGLKARPLELRVIAHGESFHFFADDEWIGEMNDSTILEGAVGFAAQNYSEAQRGRFRLRALTVESRPVEVEKAYYRWVRYLPADPQRRFELARTFHGMGRFLEAAVELKKAFRQGAGGAEEHRLQADAYRSLKLYEESLQALERSLALEPEHEEALLAKAEILVLGKRYLEARDYMASILSRFASNPVLHNLLGGCQYALGNWEAARDAYRQALALSPGEPLFLGNLGRTLERLGQTGEALAAYLEAARSLFCAEAYDELSFVLARGRAAAEALKAPEGRELRALEAKMLFHQEKANEAEVLLRELLDEGSSDASLHYLYALLRIGRGERREAEEHLRRATELEPSFALYWFRLAENRFLLGGDPTEALDKAQSLEPEEPWSHNLRGQLLLKQGRPEQALECFRRALARLPDEADLYRNAVAALLAIGRPAEAVELAGQGLQRAGERAELYTARANSRAALREFAAALDDYERALELDPDNPDYLANCASCCLELDMVQRAEELLSRLMDLAPSATAYNFMGNLAVIQDDHLRAELAYQEGLKLEPENEELALNLTSLYLSQGGYAKARQTLEPLLARAPQPPRALELQRRLREHFEQELACAGCDRRWWVPKELPPQPAFKVRGEPAGEAPAGRCPRCGKIYCIACAAPYAREGQLTCPSCGERLRLTEDSLKYLFLSYLPPT